MDHPVAYGSKSKPCGSSFTDKSKDFWGTGYHKTWGIYGINLQTVKVTFFPSLEGRRMEGSFINKENVEMIICWVFS